MKRVLLLFLLPALQAATPVLLFTDLTSGPATGNSDNSQLGQVAGQDGVIVTVWGKNLGTSPGSITVGGQAARIYSWGNATGPADLYTRHKMQMVAFQIPHGLASGATIIQATVGGVPTNTLPFAVRTGNIYYVDSNGNDPSTGSWSAPWRTVSTSVMKLYPGDTLYLENGVQQTVEDGQQHTTMSLEYTEDASQYAMPAMPKAVIAYPGAKAQIGTTSLDSWSVFVTDNYDASNWIMAKLILFGQSAGAPFGRGWRIVGNHVSAPNGDQETGCVVATDSTNSFVLGNEITNCGYAGTSKLYHPLYVSSLRPSIGPRAPDEANREIGWNYLHDNYAYDGINIYSEDDGGPYTAYMLNTLVHDNFVLNQSGRGMFIGQYMVGPDNYIYNNVIINAGQGPVSIYTTNPQYGYYCVQFSAGSSAYSSTTTIHFYNNTLFNCGFTDAANNIIGAMLTVDTSNPFTLDFRNNIVRATNWPYTDSGLPPGSGTRNIWYGQGTAPSGDTSPVDRDPKVVSDTDMHLQSGSPAIGAGSTASPSVSVDFDNLTRPSPPSIGAYELLSADLTPLIITSALPNGMVDIAYSQTVSASGGGDITWMITSGSLPAGLSGCNNVTGPSCTISGVPATAESVDFTLNASNSVGSVTRTFTLTINPRQRRPPRIAGQIFLGDPDRDD